MSRRRKPEGGVGRHPESSRGLRPHPRRMKSGAVKRALREGEAPPEPRLAAGVWPLQDVDAANAARRAARPIDRAQPRHTRDNAVESASVATFSEQVLRRIWSPCSLSVARGVAKNRERMETRSFGVPQDDRFYFCGRLLGTLAPFFLPFGSSFASVFALFALFSPSRRIQFRNERFPMPASELTDLTRLAVHTVTNKPWSLAQCIEGYAAAGIRGISVWRNALEGPGPTQAGKMLRDAGMRVPALVRGGFFPAARGVRPAGGTRRQPHLHRRGPRDRGGDDRAGGRGGAGHAAGGGPQAGGRRHRRRPARTRRRRA